MLGIEKSIRIYQNKLILNKRLSYSGNEEEINTQLVRIQKGDANVKRKRLFM